jgi:hypothetical protein
MYIRYLSFYPNLENKGRNFGLKRDLERIHNNNFIERDFLRNPFFNAQVFVRFLFSHTLSLSIYHRNNIKNSKTYNVKENDSGV